MEKGDKEWRRKRRYEKRTVQTTYAEEEMGILNPKACKTMRGGDRHVDVG